MLTSAEKIHLYRLRFSGRTDIYGSYDPQTGRTWQVKGEVTEKVIRDHLTGRRPFGVYLLRDSVTFAVVADFDDESLLPIQQLVERGRHYGIPVYTERSKRKGHHVWIFFAQPVSAFKARRVMRHLLEESGSPHVEIFPKQERIGPGESGNFIHAPLFGRLVPAGRTVFVDPDNDFKPFSDQWRFLDSVQCIAEDELDGVITANRLGEPPARAPRNELGTFEGPSGLPPCARRMLAEGVERYQRVACFRLAVNLRRMGLDFESTVAVLEHWAARNRPLAPKRVITRIEIKAQAAHAYLKEYHGYGCDDPAVVPFCDAACPILNSRRDDT